MVTFPAAESHRPLIGTKLYCMVTRAQRCEQLARSQLRPDWELLIGSPDVQPVVRRRHHSPHTHRAIGCNAVGCIHTRETQETELFSTTALTSDIGGYCCIYFKAHTTRNGGNRALTRYCDGLLI